MTFQNDAEFQDDFRKIGDDVTADFERPGAPSDPTGHASSENVEVAGAPDTDEDDDLEDDEDLDEEDDSDEDDDLEDDDDEDLDDEDDEDDEAEYDDEDDDEDDEEDEDEGDDKVAVASRLKDAETRARAR